MIKVGDTLPAATLMEFSEVEGNGCSIGPNPVDVAKATAGKTKPAPTAADKSSPQRFVPSEQVRADFDVSFPIDI